MTRTTDEPAAPALDVARDRARDLRDTAIRDTGIEVVGGAPWGTHFCQFYSGKEDLADVLVPYFRAGLEAGEYCMWITSPPLGVSEAWEALARAVPDLEGYRARGQIEILPHTEWYLAGGTFDQDRVLDAWVAKLQRALARGFSGLRLTGNTFWLEKSDWRSFAEYEAAIDRVLGQYRMLALCTYSLERCGASEVADVIRNHQFAIIKRDGRWELFESFDRRRMQDALAEQRERLAVTLESIGDAVIATDTEGRVTTLNRTAEALTGWRQEEAAGRPIGEVFRIVDERTGAGAADPVGKVLGAGAVVDLEDHFALVTRGGRSISIADCASPIRGRGGATLGVVLVFRDVSAERRSQQALRESEQRVRLKLESILHPEGDVGNLDLQDIVDGPDLQALLNEFHQLVPIPMAVIDLQGKVLVGVGWQRICSDFHRVHPETCAHCVESDTQLSAGISPGEIKLYKCKNGMWDIATPLFVGGHHAGNVFLGQFFFEDEQVDTAHFAAQAEQYGFDREQYLAALDAVPRLSRRNVELATAFFRRLAAMLSRLSYSNLKLARAITERDALMESLRQSNERLADVDRRKDEFLGMLSHELRNPLGPIRNSIYILDRADPASEQARRARAVIERQSVQLTRLVDDLLDVTRIARGKIELRRGRVDLAKLVRRAGEDHGGLMRERGLELRLEVPPGPMWVDGDAVRLAQIVGNLLHNSAKFTARGGKVLLALVSSPGAVEIRVQDTGDGLDPELLERVFEPFVQADRTLARTGGGLGLGLAMVKGLTELHGGSVRAASAGPGQGAEFVARLPVAPGAPEACAAVPPPQDGRHRRVLVVDDSRDAAESLAELVRMFGHTVEVAQDGPTALAKARACDPEVVFCDIGLPGMNGYDVARALRAQGPHAVRLVALSGYAQPDDLKKAAEAGFDSHVAKPANLDDIRRLLA
jgi:PAS domain S-box-containing protein